jgi:hypothetical protein
VTACRVVFRDKWRDVSVVLPTEPLLVPRELRTVSRSPELLVLGPPENSDELGADIVAGSVPLLHLDGDRARVAWLDLPPPLPLTIDDLKVMWQQLTDVGLPIPASVAVQGRLPSGRLELREQLLVDYLEPAHRLARELLAHWPRRRGSQVRWQHLELPGGREDPVLTARQGARFPGVSTARGTLPARSARRISADPPWTSQTLARAAVRAVRHLRDADWLGSAEERGVVERPFLDLATRASVDPTRPDPPLSSWPAQARQLLELLLALGAVASATHDQRPTIAPLCYVWRLYEAWVASEVLLAFDQRDDTSRTGLVTGRPGCEWLASWDVPGGELFVCSQLRVGRTPVHPDHRLPAGVRSNTSVLIPDVSVFLIGADHMAHVVVDAKRRSGAAMAPDDVAEAASKYVWGLRFGPPSGAEPRIDVDRAIIATTAAAPTMFSTDSRIDAVSVRPGSSAALAESLLAALGLEPRRRASPPRADAESPRTHLGSAAGPAPPESESPR